MGLYLNANSKGGSLEAKGKAKALFDDGAKPIPAPTIFTPWMIAEAAIRKNFLPSTVAEHLSGKMR